MKLTLIIISCLVFLKNIFADLKYHPIKFKLTTEKEIYYEGEKITFLITLTNTNNQNTYPVLIPHTQNIGQKLFYLNAYDKANNSLVLRYTENKMLNMLVKDTGSVKIKYLKPLEEITIPIYLNDFENYYSYHTQTSSHHSFNVPLFAGIYKINVTYNPKGILFGDSIYNYYDNTDEDIPYSQKLAMPSNGETSNMVEVKIKRSSDTIVSIERKKYFIKTDNYYYYYLSENVNKIVTDLRCMHITNLPADSFSLIKNEYFYSHFTDLYAEYISRFNDGDIREYRKFIDYCPDYLYTEKYNDYKQKIMYALQLTNKQFYRIIYTQPGNKKREESYCSSDGTICNVTEYIYDKNGEFIKIKSYQTKPCLEIQLDDQKKE